MYQFGNHRTLIRLLSSCFVIGSCTATVQITAAADTNGSVESVTPGVDAVSIPAAPSSDSQLMIEDVTGAEVASVPCTGACGTAWVPSTNLGLKGGDVYTYVVTCGSAACATQPTGQFSVPPSYCRPVLLRSDTTDAAGGRVITFAVDGHEIQQRIAPPGFDPVTASAAQLVTYGFPPRPTPPADSSAWVQAMSHFTHSVSTPPCIMDGVRASFSPTNPSINWSGVEAYTNISVKYTEMQGYFYQPATEPTACAAPYAASIWVGLGGDNGQGLLQTGTEMDYFGSGIWPWYEEISNTGSDTGQLKYDQEKWLPGDLMWFDVGYDQSSHQAGFTAYDMSLGSLISAEDNSASSYWNGTTAEAIAERTEVKYSGAWKFPHLEQFGPNKNVLWTEAYVTDTQGSETVPFVRAHVNPVMQDDTGTQLSHLSTSGTNWYNNWDNQCGSVDPP